MQVKVYSASKFPQKKIDAPAAVSIITAQDIKDYGYRTLADILRSIRGLNLSYDRSYTSLGVRGFGRPGDYNSRILLLIDGYRTNEALFDQASLGTDFLLDNELIDRVEFVPGSGSAVYGSNAFFGVVNVITKSGKGIKGMEASGEVWSYGTDKERVTVGKQFENGLDVLLSASRYDSDGQDLFFPEFNTPGTNNGVAENLDADYSERAFGKFSWHDLTFETGYVSRRKQVPTATFGTVFNGQPNFNEDSQAFFDLSYNTDLSPDFNVYAHAYHGRSDVDAEYLIDPRLSPADPADFVINKNQGVGRWAGADVKMVDTHLDGHKFVFGSEYQNNWSQSGINYDIDPNFVYQDIHESSSRYAFYAADDMTIFDPLNFNIGVRYDHYSTFGDTINPRIAMIYKFNPETALKLLYGTAFRAPSAYELYFDGQGFNANPDLKPEKIDSYEIAFEYQPQRSLRFVATGFRNEIDGLIGLQEDPDNDLLIYKNIGQVEIWGAELELEKLWDNGLRLRSSYTWNRARDGVTGEKLINSPVHLVKLNFSAPLWEERFRFGVETQYTSERLTLDGADTNGYPLVNLTLRTDKLFQSYLKGLEISGSIYNLADEDYASVGGEEHEPINVIPQDGRNFRLQLNYHY
ncbi:MAG: TonB-dependent receptor plug domain-containing protein [Methylococcaceae bacterium]